MVSEISINGAMSFGLTLARTFAPIGAALLAGQLGGYRSLLWLLVALTLLGGLAVLQIGRAVALIASPAQPTLHPEGDEG